MTRDVTTFEPVTTKAVNNEANLKLAEVEEKFSYSAESEELFFLSFFIAELPTSHHHRDLAFHSNHRDS